MANAPTTTEKQGLGAKILPLFGVFVSVLFLANLSMGGIIPFEIPDVIPGIGNLDEVFFSGLLFASLSKLGINLWGRRPVDAPFTRRD